MIDPRLIPASPRPRVPDRSHARGLDKAFTLIEVLVVVAIIALLISILIPSLTAARDRSRITVCQSNLHQLGLSVTAYASQGGTIPFGPTVDFMPVQFLEPNDGKLATNQIWTGPQTVQPANDVVPQKMALGLLLGRGNIFPKMMFCPGDDTNDPVEEYDKITRRRSDTAAYGSYLYRQLQETNGTGRLDRLGLNTSNGRVQALALDLNSLLSLSADSRRTNHRAVQVNILFRDASARAFSNRQGEFALRDQDLSGDPRAALSDLAIRRAAILREADRKY